MKEGEEGKTAQIRALYESVEGLDFAEALRFLGSEEAAERTLLQFFDGITESADEMERLLRAGDYGNLTIRVHALKGTARALGAAGLSDRAAEMEALGLIVTGDGEET